MTDRSALPPNLKPPLTAGLKASAAIAGILGFLFNSVGWTIMITAVIAGSLPAALTAVLAAGGSPVDAATTSRIVSTVSSYLASATIPLVVAGVVGAIIWLLGLFISRGILRRAGHYRPWGITWAGLGIAILISLLVSAIGGVIGGMVTPALLSGVVTQLRQGAAPTVSTFQPLVTEAIAYGIAYLVLTILIGWISWSLMARALRPTAHQLDARDQKLVGRAAAVAPHDPVEAPRAPETRAPDTRAPETRASETP